MKPMILMLAAMALLLGGVGQLKAGYVVGIRSGNPAEQAALTTTLQSLGDTVVVKSANDYSGIDVFLAYPGGGGGPSPAQIAGGVKYIQISDWGSNWTSNNYNYIGSQPITLQVDNPSPLTTGVDSTWNAFGFWHYGSPSYVGWSTDTTLTSLVSETAVTHKSEVLVNKEIGSGRAVYIGWNVYGSDAGPNDVRVLSNSIEWAVTGSVTPDAAPAPAPSSLVLLGTAAATFAGYFGWRRRSQLVMA